MKDWQGGLVERDWVEIEEVRCERLIVNKKRRLAGSEGYSRGTEHSLLTDFQLKISLWTFFKILNILLKIFVIRNVFQFL